MLKKRLERLILLPWWNKPQEKSKVGESYDFKIQIIYCGLAEACGMLMELAKEMKKHYKEIDAGTIPLLNLAPPAVSAEAKKHYETYFPERKEAKTKIKAKIASLHLDKLGMHLTQQDLEF